LIDFDRSPNPLRKELVQEKFEMIGTSIVIPDRPGIGVTLNRNAMGKFLKE
jgi:D-galactarolactone cycloisomerase